MRFMLAMAMLTAASAPCAFAAGDEGKTNVTRSIEGSWTGALKVTPQAELKVTLDVARAKDGSLSAKWGSPDQGANDLPVDAIAFSDGVLTFSAKNAGASFKGTLGKNASEVAGEWLQAGRPFPLTFTRTDPTKIAAAAPIPKSLEGLWHGTLTLNGGLELRLVLKVEPGKDGSLKAILASPDQGANNIPISSIALSDKNALTFESKAIGAKFVGKRNEKGTAYDGEFHQSGMKLPLTLTKTDKVSERPRPQTPKAPFPYRAEDIKYENQHDAVRLAGTLTLPQGSGPFPAVILITGSGAQDRDETILGHKPFLVLADYLTRRGIAVLRVDDRGVGGSTGHIATSTSENFASDVLAGVHFLKARKDIAPKKIGLIGHSEGGIIAPMVATRSKDVAFIVLMAGTGLNGSEILQEQSQLIMKASGSSASAMSLQRVALKKLTAIIAEEKDEKAAQKKLAAALKEIIAALPEAERKSAGDTPGGLSEASVDAFNNAWFRFFLTYDPRPTLRKVKCPVLAINGEKDLQVPSKQNLAEIGKAVKAGGNRNVTIVELPGLNHLFQPCKTGTPSEYALIETTIAPQALKTIGDWIAERTLAK